MKYFITLIVLLAFVLVCNSQNKEYVDSLSMDMLKELLESKEDTLMHLSNNSECSEYKYFVKRKSLNGGYCLELKPATTKDSIARIRYGSLIEDRDLFLDYSYHQKIEILKELMEFQGDTTESGKSYKIMTSDLSRIYIEPFTIQIEALYTFSRMLLLGFPSFLPILTDVSTEMNYNGCQTVVDDVYDIYRQWLEEAIKTRFKNINFPLFGCKYQWKRQEKISEKWFIDFHN